jgi:hypothetical protein
MTWFHGAMAHNSAKCILITLSRKGIKWRCGEVRRGAKRSKKRILGMKYGTQCLDAVSEHEDIILSGSGSDIYFLNYLQSVS